MRLIDADALIQHTYSAVIDGVETDIIDVSNVDNAPTVCGNNSKWCESCVSKGKCASTRPQGEWIEKLDYNRDTYYDCSVCGNSWTTIEGTPWDNGMNFCPNCGAEMKGGTE